MPLNPKGTMFPFNGDISGVVAALGDAGVGACWVPVSCAASISGPSPPPSPRLPLLCSQADQRLVNLTEGFVPSVLAHQLGESPAWELADILMQPGPA